MMHIMHYFDMKGGIFECQMGSPDLAKHWGEGVMPKQNQKSSTHIPSPSRNDFYMFPYTNCLLNVITVYLLSDEFVTNWL